MNKLSGTVCCIRSAMRATHIRSECDEDQKASNFGCATTTAPGRTGGVAAIGTVFGVHGHKRHGEICGEGRSKDAG